MVTCDNCDKQAVYTCADPGLSPINYCTGCLPIWLHSRAEAGHFPLVGVAVEETKPAPKTKKKAAPSDENN